MSLVESIGELIEKNGGGSGIPEYMFKLKGCLVKGRLVEEEFRLLEVTKKDLNREVDEARLGLGFEFGFGLFR